MHIQIEVLKDSSRFSPNNMVETAAKIEMQRVKMEFQSAHSQASTNVVMIDYKGKYCSVMYSTTCTDAHDNIED